VNFYRAAFEGILKKSPCMKGRNHHPFISSGFEEHLKNPFDKAPGVFES